MEGLTGKRTFAAGVGRFLDMSAPILRRWARPGFFSRRRREGEPPARVLLLACGQIGDVFWASQVAGALRDRLGPSALWVGTSPHCRALWHGLVPPERVLDLASVVSDQSFAWAGLWAAGAALRTHAFDVVVDLTGNRSSALVAFLARPGRVYGGADCELSRLYSTALPAPEAGSHAALRPWHVAAPLLGPPPSAPPEPRAVLPADDSLTELGLSGASRFVVLVPGAGWASKRWPVDRFGQLAAELEAMHLRVVVTGSEAERLACEAVAARARTAKVLAGTPIESVAALLRGARLVVSNDSGFAHLAAAYGTPTVALFNSTNPACFRPLGPNVRVLRSGCADQPYGAHAHCHDTPDRACPASCWDDLDTRRVLAACTRLLLS